MKGLIFYLSLLFLIVYVNMKLTDQESQELLNKLTKKISLENIDDFKALENRFKSGYLKETIDYDPSQIKKIISQYEFPEEYNFLEEHNITARVKDQGRCGSCWSHSATTALAYRYFLKGIDVDLSPQDGLSCYIRDCESGNYIIDSQLNLVKNGTLTEGCLPFSSGDGISMEECPTSCKDGSEFKKYYSQNAYMTEDYYSKDTFYDIVTLIMDQLTKNGPIVTSIDVYGDFVELHYDSQKCQDEVYTYDGQSEYYGGHAIVIVGYGFLKDKYYWLIQNSWGEEVCDQGFVKVEFGQVGVENVAFSEPYIHNEGVIPVEIPVSFSSIDEECFLKVATTSSYDKWENSLDLNFKHSEVSRDFNFQCSTISLPQKQKKLSCYFDIFNYLKNKGVYEFKSSKSLGTENKFILDDTFQGQQFTFWGYDSIYPLFYSITGTQYFYVSEEGSRIIFYYTANGGDESILPPIYPNINSEKPLNDCHYTPINNSEFNILYCDIKKDEIDYFEDKVVSDSPVIYDTWCGYKETTETIVYKLDKTKYPVFRFKNIYLTKNYIEFNATVAVEGSVSELYHDNFFIVYTDVEKNNKNTTFLTMCVIGSLKETNIDTNITCIINTELFEFDNVYILPFTFPYYGSLPFEVRINGIIKGIIIDPDEKPDPKPDPEPDPEPDPTPSFSNSFKISFIIIGFLLLF